LADCRNLQTLDINNLAVAIVSKAHEECGGGLLNSEGRISHNNKKDTRKIYIGFIPNKTSISYKIPLLKFA
jgi:hypothetical protein